jgi:hypothetical protein
MGTTVRPQAANAASPREGEGEGGTSEVHRPQHGQSRRQQAHTRKWVSTASGCRPNYQTKRAVPQWLPVPQQSPHLDNCFILLYRTGQPLFLRKVLKKRYTRQLKVGELEVRPEVSYSMLRQPNDSSRALLILALRIRQAGCRAATDASWQWLLGAGWISQPARCRPEVSYSMLRQPNDPSRALSRWRYDEPAGLSSRLHG